MIKVPLVPFRSSESKISIEAGVARSRNGIQLSFSCSGLEPEIVAGAKLGKSLAEAGDRADKLWETTCFEAYFAPMGRDEYWEFNLSPQAKWNLYRFSGERMGMRREESISQVNIEFSLINSTLQVQAEFRMPRKISPMSPLEIGLTAIIGRDPNEVSYWAIEHLRGKPDFHVRESFRIELV